MVLKIQCEGEKIHEDDRTGHPSVIMKGLLHCVYEFIEQDLFDEIHEIVTVHLRYGKINARWVACMLWLRDNEKTNCLGVALFFFGSIIKGQR